ncbi:MAG TPA: hypothetical protein VII69_07085 [Candidatus Eremiobacteraceae bacterium]
MTIERQTLYRDLIEWIVVAVAIAGAWPTIAFTAVTRQIPLAPIVTAVLLAILYWRLASGLVWVYFGYQSRIAKLKTIRAAALRQSQASTSDASE